MMETIVFLSSIVASLFFHTVDADDLICGDKECRGGHPYCCQLDDGSIGCCWNSPYYALWWFWSLWIFAALLLFCCCYRCHRRRREGVRYVVMNNSEYPSYGTVVHPPRVYNAPPPSYTVPPAVAALPPGVIPAGAVPTKPPSYAAAEASKPPPYAAA